MGYLDELNPPQREAVEKTEGPLLVLAGAGSGKTRVLTCRVAKLIEESVPAWRILALTFTNKAAREMAERVQQLTGEAGQGAWVSTFHSCCARILRRDIEKLGYKRDFSIYDEDDRMGVIKSVCKSLMLGDREYPPRVVRSVISDAKNRMLTPDEWLQDAGEDAHNRKLAEAYARYEKTLRENNALDFDDLLVKTLVLFTEQPPVLEYYRARFDYVLVDEYQDTNAAQYQFVRLLAGEKRNLCVVGDDDQSIYGWRGADIRNILEFERDFPDCTVIKLEQNYRSTGNILDAANQVIAHNAGRKEKTLWTSSAAGDKLCLYHAADERDEATFIANMAQKLMKQGTRPGEIAVLYRTNAQSRVLEDTFVRRGVPYRIYGGLRFYDRKEVKDIIAYMRVLVNPDDDVATRRIINEPKRGIGESTVDALAAYAEANNTSLMGAVLSSGDVGLPTRAAKLVGGFAQLMLELTEALYTQTLTEFTATLIEKTGYVDALERNKTEENQSRIENIHELEGAVDEFEKLNPEGTLSDFLENVSLVTDTDELNESGGAVTLMTLHSAKGLEFDAVFLAGMEEGIFPISRAFYDEHAMEEERRLAYVGITRAKHKLYLSHARTRLLYNTRSANELSRFVDEIPRRLIQDGGERMNMRVPPPTTYIYDGKEYIHGGTGRASASISSHGKTTGAAYDGMKTASPHREDARAADTAVGSTSSAAGVGKASARPDALNIPGVRRGVCAVESAAQPAMKLFRPGDRVAHSVYGAGTVESVDGAGAQQKVTINFDSGVSKRFNVNVAPLRRID